MQKQYDINIVPGKYLYRRCHLIGWSIGGIVIDYATGESKLAD